MLSGLLTLVGSSSLNAQLLYRGNLIIDPYYGFPNFSTFYMYNYLPISDFESVDRLGIGPWGVRVEYLLTDKLGITLDGIHNSGKITEVKEYETYDAENNIIVESYTHRAKMDRYRFQVGLNFHTTPAHPMMDFYYGAAIGSNYRTWSLDTGDDPFYYDDFDFENLGVFIPLSLRLRLGGRYYFDDVFGINMELGLGGPLLSAGLSIKF